MDIIIENVRIRFSHDPITFSTDKTTFIFLHDSLGCIELWRDFPEKLQSLMPCNIISYDRQGYGQSAPFTIQNRTIDYLHTEAHILHVIITQLNLTNVVLFGHSDGGSIALLTAALYPEKIKAIITEGAHVFVEKETLSGIEYAQQQYHQTDLKKRLSKYHGKKTDMVFSLWVETWLSPSFKLWNIEKYLSKILCPSLIIQGEKDEYGTIKQVQAITSQIKGYSEALIIPETGHTPHKENPDIVLKEVYNFVKHHNLNL